MKKIKKLMFLISVLVILFLIGRTKAAEFYNNRGNDHYNRQLYAQAANDYSKALKFYPSALVRYALANAYREGKLEDQAIEEYKEILQKDRRFTKAYLALIKIYLARKSYPEALEWLDKAVVAVPNDPEIQELKRQADFRHFADTGAAAFQKGDVLQARHSLQNAIQAEPHSPQAHYLIANSFYVENDYYRAEDHLKTAIKLDPNFYQAYSFLGDIYFGKGNFEEAIENYKSSLAIHGEDALVLNNMGLAYMNLERYGSAISYLEKAVALDPNNVNTRRNLAGVYRDYGVFDKAVAEFTKVMSMKPDFPDIYNDLGDIYKKQGKKDAALATYRKGIKNCEVKLSQNLENPAALNELAYAYNETQEYDKAKILIDKAITINPHYQKAYLTLASIYRNSGRPDAALIALDKANQLSPQGYVFVEEAINSTEKQWADQRNADRS